jgi:dephospho-CoA kinase
MAFTYAVALTGGIGTGKSSVARMFGEDGYTVIDADKIAHQVLEQQKEKISELFGPEMIKEERVDRKVLGAVVFADPFKRKKLEALLHPLIYEEIVAQAEVEDMKEKPYIVDIPLFFEGGRYPIRRTLVVYAPQEQQVTRTIMRDELGKEAVLERIAAQMDIEEKRYLGDFVIDNSGDQKQLRVEYERIKEAIEKEFA